MILAKHKFLNQETPNTCICLIENDKSTFIKYLRYPETEFASRYIKGFHHIQYSSLDSKKGWNMQNIEIIAKIESTGKPFGEIYKTRTGIATLKNNVYVFKPIKEDKSYFYLQQNDNIYKIEKGICKDVINSNKTNSNGNLKDFKEQLIFPYRYNGLLPELLDEEILKRKYPNTYSYLEKNKTILAGRDKGKMDTQIGMHSEELNRLIK